MRSIFETQTYDSIKCRYSFIEFIDFMLKVESLTDFKNLFSPNNFRRILKIGIDEYIKQNNLLITV